MKKQYIIGSLAFLTFFGVIMGFNQFSADNHLSEVKVQASWAKYYDTTDSLVKASDVIIKGKVKQNLPAYIVGPGDVPNTDSIIRVEKVAKNKIGDVLTPEITIVQTGGIHNNVNYKFDKVEIVQENKNYILFLRYDQFTKKYVVLGGFQGQYKLDNGFAKHAEEKRNMEETQLFAEIEKAKKQ